MSDTVTPTARTLLPTPYDRETWLATRRLGVGGSDAASIVGASRYRSALELWQEKTGIGVGDNEPEPEPGPDDPRWWGLQLEDDVDAAFRHTTGLDTTTPPGLLAHIDRAWQLANPDRFVYADGVLVGLLEIKTTGGFAAPDWAGDDIPAAALLQVQHYLAVTGLPAAWVAGLIAGQRFVVKPVHRDDELIDELTAREHEFWQHVISGTPPPADGSKSAGLAVQRQYPVATDDDDGVVLTTADIEAVATLRDVETQLHDLTTTRDMLAQQIRQTLGEHTVGYDGERAVVRWSNVNPGPRLDTKALQAAHPDLTAAFMRPPKPYRRFTLLP